jgi:hypothetical protein
MRAVVDNDILSKGASYRFLPQLVTSEVGDEEPVGILGAARFVVAKKIAKAGLRNGPQAAIAQFAEFVARAESVEPTEAEQQLAARLELSAQKQALNLHSGESQLCAIVLTRDVPLFLTGDKQAIAAMERMLDVDRALLGLRGRMRCLEQLIFALLGRSEPGSVRAAICDEPNVDQSLSICFSCAAAQGNDESIVAGLESYIGDVRRNAARLFGA